jgi:hypothetical protein
MAYQTDRLFEEYRAIRAHVPAEDLSSLNSLDQLYAKVLVISSGSEFETIVSNMMLEFATAGAKIPEITTLIQRKAIERQYFQNFAWEAKNINKFLSLFGGRVRDSFDAKLAADELSQQSIIDFIQSNNHRNELIHRNFAAASIEMTPDEVMKRFSSAVVVCDVLRTILGDAAAPGPPFPVAPGPALDGAP